MRRIVFVLGLAVLLAGAGHRVLAAGDAGAFINEAGNSVLKLLNDPKVSQAQFTQQLHKIADDDFDVPRIARFVTGRYWRDANDSGRQLQDRRCQHRRREPGADLSPGIRFRDRAARRPPSGTDRGAAAEDGARLAAAAASPEGER